MKLLFSFLSVLCCLQGSVLAQFYAPPVDFHDQVQRRFPVEAARVLAWIRNGGKPGIVEVTYYVETSLAGETLWSFEWAGKPGREVTVRYPDGALRNGAEWYRSVWKQLTGADWALSKAAPASDLAAAFWDGAESGGLTRFEGIDSAFKQIDATPLPAGAAAARLAGTLVQAALSSVGYEVTLDGTLLARSAAWLCAAEQQTGAAAGPEWATILVLAGRGPECAEAWAKRSERPLPVWRCWDLLIRQPAASEALATIALPENRLFAAPIFIAYNSMDPGYADIFRDLSSKLYPGENFARLLDYGPELNRVRGRKPYAEIFPMRFLQQWIERLRSFTPLPGDAQDVMEQARAVHDLDGKYSPTLAPSKEFADLLNRAGRQVKGPLIPVAVVTANDLLIYGWDFGGIQLADLHNTYSIHPTLHEKARALESGWLAQVSGWTAFNINTRVAAAAPLDTSERYQFIAQSRVARLLNSAPPPEWPKTDDAYARRRWLIDPHRALEFQMNHGGETKSEAELLRRAIREATPYRLGSALANEDILDQAFQSATFPDALKLREELLRAVPASTVGQISLIDRQFDSNRDPFGFAQALERAHWSTGLGIAPKVVFLNYVRANAVTSAFRFYDRWSETAIDKGDERSRLATAAFTLAALQSDTVRAQTLLKDVHPHAAITAALLNEDLGGATKAIAAYLKKFPKAMATPAYESLRDDVFPLIPALKDPKHPDHARALETFPKEDFLLFDQWVIYSRAHLSPADAIRFFSTSEMTGERALVVAALKGDKVVFQELFEAQADELFSPNAMNFGQQGPRAILYAWLRNLLFQIPPPKEEPDLMPPGARPLLPRLRELLKESGEAAGAAQ
ncbi:MAG: hypothetical protein QOE70_6438 [Chthoniobacter sp.]|jgi:hypothetical protein|nr:hypothetical protein [Chthoniobacter sp.]